MLSGVWGIRSLMGPWLVLGKVVLAGLSLGVAPGYAASVMQAEPPPIPYIVQGEVFVEGYNLEEAATLVARIDDWESVPVPVVNGEFVNLLIAPPTRAYADKTVTYHMLGMRAWQTTHYQLTGAPVSLKLRLDFGESAVATPTSDGSSLVRATTVSVPEGRDVTDKESLPGWLPAFLLLVLGGVVLGAAVLVAAVRRR